MTGVPVQDATRKRRSTRVTIHIPVEVVGIDINGEDFVEPASTETVSRHGGTIVIRRALAPGRVLHLRRTGVRFETGFRVIGKVSVQSGCNVYGIEFENATSDLLGISFPPEDPSASARVVLTCAGCGSVEKIVLSEIVMDVFRLNGHLQRDCKTCFGSTRWTLVEDEALDVQPSQEQSVSNAGAERRRHKRIGMALAACIRQPGQSEEVVNCVDVSKGGMRFHSRIEYERLSWVEVAVPYTAEGANIFVSARIVRVHKHSSGMNDYGVQYLQKK